MHGILRKSFKTSRPKAPLLLMETLDAHRWTFALTFRGDSAAGSENTAVQGHSEKYRRPLPPIWQHGTCNIILEKLWKKYSGKVSQGTKYKQS